MCELDGRRASPGPPTRRRLARRSTFPPPRNTHTTPKESALRLRPHSSRPAATLRCSRGTRPSRRRARRLRSPPAEFFPHTRDGVCPTNPLTESPSVGRDVPSCARVSECSCTAYSSALKLEHGGDRGPLPNVRTIESSCRGLAAGVYASRLHRRAAPVCTLEADQWQNNATQTFFDSPKPRQSFSGSARTRTCWRRLRRCPRP